MASSTDPDQEPEPARAIRGSIDRVDCPEDLAEIARRASVRPIPLWMKALVAIAFLDTPLLGVGTTMMACDALRVPVRCRRCAPIRSSRS
jgi:hypothetical protein